MRLTMTKAGGSYAFYLDDKLYEVHHFASDGYAQAWLRREFGLGLVSACDLYESLARGGHYDF